MAEPLLRMTNISKSFPGVQALDNVALDVDQAEIHGLLGENGAGKSTLMKILAGAYRPDAGTIEFDGEQLELETPLQAQENGIVTIYQEFNLIPSLSIAENVFIGREPGRWRFIHWRALREQTLEIIERLGIHLDPMATVRSLTVAEQQMVEIAKALSMDSRLIIMDEPTSALSQTEVQRLFQIIRDLKSRGISIIFITHRLEEVLTLCDRVTVLRDGQKMGTRKVTDVTIDDIIRMMVGRSVDELFQHQWRKDFGEPVLRVEHLSRTGTARDPNAIVLNDITFEVRRGEILGLAGLIGAGRTELARAIFGADAFSQGRVFIDGKQARIKSPADAIRQGIGLVPEDRKQQALFLSLAVRPNISITKLGDLLRWGGIIRENDERSLVEQYQQMLNIRMASQEQRVVNLSGGNQQKVVLARWLAMQPRVLIVDEPTRGIDVAAKSEVHALLDEMANNGIAVIMISSELPEILNMSDRIITIREGHLTGEIMREAATEEKLMHMMTVS